MQAEFGAFVQTLSQKTFGGQKKISKWCLPYGDCLQKLNSKFLQKFASNKKLALLCGTKYPEDKPIFSCGFGGGNKFSKLSLVWEVIFSRKELIPFESTVFELACKTNINWTLYLKQNIETTSWVNSTIPQKHFSYTRDFFYSRRDPS